jgi:thiamine-phosphate pyrophosphorylase
MNSIMTKSLQLCLVTHFPRQSFEHYKNFLLQAISGGVTSVQLRDKEASFTEMHRLALELKTLLSPLNIPLIINDQVAIAQLVDAAGVHIGQSDESPVHTRKRLSLNKWIGLSIESLDDLTIANQLNCIDYVGASAVFPSQTKPDCKTLWGLDGLKMLTQQSKHPVVAIGGITINTIESVVACGVCGVAVVGALHNQPNPKQSASDLYAFLQR